MGSTSQPTAGVYQHEREKKREARTWKEPVVYPGVLASIQPAPTPNYIFFVMGKCTIFNNGEYHRYSDLNNVVVYVYHIMKS